LFNFKTPTCSGFLFTMQKLIFILLLSPIILVAQSTDSLLLQIKTAKNAQEKSEAYYKAAWTIKDKNPDEAENIAREFLAFASKQKMMSQKASALNILGVITRGKGNYSEALEYQISSLKIYDSLQLKKDIATLYNNIGVTHMYNGVNSEAIKNYTKALDISKEIKDDNTKNLALNNLGIIYCYEEDFEEGIKYFKQSLLIEQKQNNLKGLSECYNNIGGAFYYLQQIDSAIHYFQKSFEIDKQLGDVVGMSGSLSNIGELLTSIGKYKEAEEKLLEALALTQQHKIAAEFQNTLLNLSGLYEQSGNLEKALLYSREYASAKDSIHSLEQSKQIAEMQTKYETEKKDEEIKHQNTVIKNERTIKYIMVGLIILLLVSVVLFYIWYRAKQQQKLQAALLKEKELGLEAIINAQEEERQRIAKDLHDGIIQQLTSLKFGLKNIFEKQPSKESEKLFSQLEESTTELRTISHQMMPKALSELGVVSAMEDMLHKSLQPIDITFSFDTFGITERLKENLEITLYRVTQELINNIIKHSGASQVSVQLFKSGKNVVLIVEDNGKGFDTNSKKDGIGILNINSRLDTVNGKVNFEPSPNSGTLATIKIPLQ
jgi:signal transduction histidine kinase